jgi:glucose/arabinose dehydrogenase
MACGSSDPTDPDGPGPTPSPGGACSATPVSGQPGLRLDRIASFTEPVDLQTPGDRSRLFVVERPGRIRILRGRDVVATPFLDITDRVGSSGSEQGLLGLAFHPRFGENGRFFVNYTDRQGDTHISEFRAATGADTADRGTERTLVFQDQPFPNHNGGQLSFGPDGFLYVGLGDGGSGGDPFGNGQNLGTLLGKLLRLDVDRAQPYAVPSDNPFVSRAGARPEIWAYGLRNPWRFAFDRVTGDLVIADVGQNAVEEVDAEPAPRRGGLNYGWNFTEGSRCFSPSSNCPRDGITFPLVEYTHSDGCSVTGGVVYRGCRMPGYAGTYFYGDFCSGFVSSFRLENGRAVDQRDWTSQLGRRSNLSSFGVDAEGEIYILELSGAVHKIIPAS